MAYTEIDDPSLYFRVVKWSGNSSTQSITFDETHANMQPDWVWIKSRSQNANHHTFDSVRGATKDLIINSTDGETTDTAKLTSFDSNGFSVGNNGNVNNSSETFVAWCWKGGTTSGISGSADITPNAYSFSQTAGFSVLTYNGTDVSGNTVLHGLGAVPHWMIVKRRVSNGYDWVVYHKDDVGGHYLNNTTTNNDSSNVNIWFNGNTPTSTQFHIGTDGRIGDNVSTGAYVAYMFAPKKGFSSFGIYQGNGNADGTFCPLTFKPSFLMVKPTSTNDNWVMFDNKRDNQFNGAQAPDFVYANKSFSENNNDPAIIDFLSNGFKMRNSGGTSNRDGETFIFMAFAESPFVNSNGVPTNAR